MNEQRRSRRFNLKLPLELLRSGSHRMLQSGETRNVSSSGVLFSSGARLEPGDVIEYVITLPSSSKYFEVRLKCRGKVVRCESDQETAATLERWTFTRAEHPRPV